MGLGVGVLGRLGEPGAGAFGTWAGFGVFQADGDEGLEGAAGVGEGDLGAGRAGKSSLAPVEGLRGDGRGGKSSFTCCGRGVGGVEGIKPGEGAR